MIELSGDLWSVDATWWRGITTNGLVKTNGECVMGRGCALQAKSRYPNLPRELGTKIRLYGNIVFLFPQYRLFTFPVKHRWMDAADPILIAASARHLREIAEQSPQKHFVLPRPGCGNGRLDWAIVEPLLRSLPDNVLVISNE